ncbi:MAG: glycosyltransferase family 9 protein [Thermomicrobiales bacterium]
MTTVNPWLGARNLLAVRLDNAGDVVMLGPALRAIKETNPETRITLLASPAGAAAAPLLPWIDDLITWRAIWQDLGHLPFDPAREQELIARLAAGSFDGALLFTSFSQTPHAAGYACYLAGIPLRAGASKEFGGAALSHRVASLPDELHQVERNLHLVVSLGFSEVDPRLQIAIPEEGKVECAARLQGAGIDDTAPLVVIHPGASAEARRYPTARFGHVARQLTDEGWTVVVTGTERERPLLDALRLGAGAAVTCLTDLSIGGFAALIAGAAAVVCNNTLPMHLADATRTPVVALYAGTDLVAQWQPRRAPAIMLRRDTPCTPCYRFTCPIGLPCLDISPDEVARAVAAVAREKPSPQRAPSPELPTRAPLPSEWERGWGEGAWGEQPSRIAVFQALNLGDLLCATPALRALRKRFPHAEITLIGRPWAEEFAHRLPSLDRFLPFPGWPGIAESPDQAVVPDWPRFDLAIQMHGSGEASNGFLASLAARQTLGFGPAGENRLTTSLPWREEEAEALRWLRLLGAVGVEPDGLTPDFPIIAAEAERTRDLVPDNGEITIGLHVGARDPFRRWPPEAFAQLGDRLAERYGARIVLTGSAEERPLTAAVSAAMRARPRDLTGATTLGELAAVVDRLDLLISNDTGLSHVAAAVRTPSVVLFGPTRPQRWAPLAAHLHRAIDATAIPGLPSDGAAALRALPVSVVLSAACAALDHMAWGETARRQERKPASRQERKPASRQDGKTVSRQDGKDDEASIIPTSDLRRPTPNSPRERVA